MYLQLPVMIPQTKGITFRTRGKRTYVQYEITREYDPKKKYNNARRVVIGIRDSVRPEMMLPNENYLEVFLPEIGQAGTEKQEMLEEYEEERQRMFMLRDLFLALFFEFQRMSRRTPNDIVNRDKVRRLNRVLMQLMEIMKEEASAEFLEMIPEPVEEEEDGKRVIYGKTYSDVALLMTQVKSIATRFFQNQF